MEGDVKEPLPGRAGITDLDEPAVVSFSVMNGELLKPANDAA